MSYRLTIEILTKVGRNLESRTLLKKDSYVMVKNVCRSTLPL